MRSTKKGLNKYEGICSLLSLFQISSLKTLLAYKIRSSICSLQTVLRLNLPLDKLAHEKPPDTRLVELDTDPSGKLVSFTLTTFLSFMVSPAACWNVTPRSTDSGHFPVISYCNAQEERDILTFGQCLKIWNLGMKFDKVTRHKLSNFTLQIFKH